MANMNQPKDANRDTSLDPVVEEVRERGRILMQRFNNDPKRLFKQLYLLSKKHPEKMVGQLRVVAVSDPN